MITEPTRPYATQEDEQRAVEEIVRRGPTGAVALAGTAVAIVVAIWIAFYVLVYLPRG